MKNPVFAGRYGYACDIAQASAGWALAYVAMDEVDDGFVSNIGRYQCAMRPNATTADWTDALVSCRRRLHLVMGLWGSGGSGFRRVPGSGDTRLNSLIVQPIRNKAAGIPVTNFGDIYEQACQVGSRTP